MISTATQGFQGVAGARNLITTLEAGKILELTPRELLNIGGATDDTLQPVIELKITGYEPLERSTGAFIKQGIIRSLSTTSNAQSVMPLTGSSSALTNSPDRIPTLTVQASTSSGEKIRLLYDPWSLSLIQNIGPCLSWNTGVSGAPWVSPNFYERTRGTVVFESNGAFIYTVYGSEIDLLLQRLYAQVVADGAEVPSEYTPCIRFGVIEYAPRGGDIFYKGAGDAIWDSSEFTRAYSVDVSINFNAVPIPFTGRIGSFPSAGTGSWTKWEVSGSRFVAGGGDLIDFINRMTSSTLSDKRLWACESPYFRASPPTLSVSIEISRRFYAPID